MRGDLVARRDALQRGDEQRARRLAEPRVGAAAAEELLRDDERQERAVGLAVVGVPRGALQEPEIESPSS